MEVAQRRGIPPGLARLLHALIPALAVSLLLAADPGGQAARLESALLDARARAHAAPRTAAQNVVILDVSEESLRRMEETYGRWPWPRQAHALAVDFLAFAGARAVAFDLIFSERTRRAQLTEGMLDDLLFYAQNTDIPEVRETLAAILKNAAPGMGDAAFVQASARAGNVLQTAVFYLDAAEAEALAMQRGEKLSAPGAAHEELAAWAVPLPTAEFAGFAEPTPLFHEAILPFAELAAASQGVGPDGLAVGRDGVVRSFFPLLRLKDGATGHPALPVLAAAMGLGLSPGDIRLEPGRLMLGKTALPLDAEGRAAIRWSEGPDGLPPFKTLPYDLVVASALRQARGDRPILDPAEFRDAVVLVGATAIGLKDVRPSPLAEVTPVVEILAQATAMLLSGDTLRPSPPWAAPAAQTALGLLAALAGTYLPALSGATALLCLLSSGVFGPWAAYGHGLILPMAGPALAAFLAYLAAVVLRYAAETREKKRIKSAFGQYLPQSVMEELLRFPEKLRLGGERRVMTVLFTDIAGFTTLSESLPPEDVSHLLSACFSRLVRCVHASGGIVDKFVGDALMAEWNAPAEVPDHAARACEAALGMIAELNALNATWKAEGATYPAIGMRVGVNTGEMIVGNMGAEEIFDYTVLGNEVNTGSRLEALNKEFGTLIAVAGRTRDEAEAHAPGRFLFRSLGAVKVKGRATGLPVYELRGLKADVPEGERAALARFEAGVAAFQDGRLSEAVENFRETLAVLPGDGPSLAYQRLCAEYAAGLPAAFDGSFTQKTK